MGPWAHGDCSHCSEMFVWLSRLALRDAGRSVEEFNVGNAVDGFAGEPCDWFNLTTRP